MGVVLREQTIVELTVLKRGMRLKCVSVHKCVACVCVSVLVLGRG